MRKAIGTVILLYAITHLMTPTFAAFQSAAVATFGSLEAAAVLAEKRFESQI